MSFEYKPKDKLELDWQDYRDEVKLAVRQSARRIEQAVMVAFSDAFVWQSQGMDPNVPDSYGDFHRFDLPSALAEAVAAEAKRLAS